MRDADGREATINRCNLPGDETDLHHEQTIFIYIFYLITLITKQQTTATILYNKRIICKLIQPVGNVQNTEDTENNA